MWFLWSLNIFLFLTVIWQNSKHLSPFPSPFANLFTFDSHFILSLPRLLVLFSHSLLSHLYPAYISIHLQDRGFTQYEWDTGLEWVTMIQWAEWTNNKQSTESHHTAQGHITDVNRVVTNRDTGQYFVPLIIFPYAPGLYINTL